jgi:hypothetical protein
MNWLLILLFKYIIAAMLIFFIILPIEYLFWRFMPESELKNILFKRDN